MGIRTITTIPPTIITTPIAHIANTESSNTKNFVVESVEALRGVVPMEASMVANTGVAAMVGTDTNGVKTAGKIVQKNRCTSHFPPLPSKQKA